jgi:hypothetical protein
LAAAAAAAAALQRDSKIMMVRLNGLKTIATDDEKSPQGGSDLT